MTATGQAVRHIEKQKAIDEGNNVESDNLTIAAIFGMLAIAEALTELERTVDQWRSEQ